MAAGKCWRCEASVDEAELGAVKFYYYPDGRPSFVCPLCNVAESEKRVREAMALVEDAQRKIGRARELLSPINGGAVAWRRLGSLYDRVRAEWYRLNNAASSWSLSHNRSDRARRNARWHCDGGYWAWKLQQLSEPRVEPAPTKPRLVAVPGGES